MFLGHFSAAGVLAGPTEFDGGSDCQAFLDRDIPPGDKYDSCYHRSCDTLGNVDPEALETMADALMHATLASGEAGTDD